MPNKCRYASFEEYWRGSVIRRFWKYIQVPADSNECWIWVGPLDTGGYGHLHICYNGHHNEIRSHRLSWEIHNNKPIPEGLCILHHCDNPPCGNPAHLWLGTSADNQADMKAKGRDHVGPWPPGKAWCSSCRDFKPYVCFSHDRTRASGYSRYCRICDNARK